MPFLTKQGQKKGAFIFLKEL